MRRPCVVSVLLIAIALAAPGWPGAQAQTSAQPYKIGLTLPLTGPLAALIVDTRPAPQIAVDEINQAGGIKGHPLQLVFEDSLGTPEGGIASMRKLVQVDGVQAIVTVFTNVTIAQLPLADQINVPLITTTETPGLLDKSRNTFAHSETYAELLPLFRDYWKRHNVKRIYAFLGNNAYGHIVEPVIKQMAADAGADAQTALLDLNQTDFRGAIAKAKDYNPDGIFITLQGSSAETAVIRQVRELGLTAPIFTQGNFFHDTTWRAGVGAYVDGITFAGLNLDDTAPFTREFQKRSGHLPTYVSGLLYDIIKMYAYAINHGGYDGEGIRNQIASMKGVPSVFGGTISMGSDHYTNLGALSLFKPDHETLVKVR